MRHIRKSFIWPAVIVLAVFLAAVAGGSIYMLDYSLAPDVEHRDTSSCFRQLFDKYPECREWTDSLRAIGALRDTFMIMPSGERHHAYYVNCGSSRTAVVIHGWRDCAVKFFFLARMYEREFGYNVVMPDLHAHGLSEGDAISMGWFDRLDVMKWMQAFKSDTMVVHGVSMGGATAMMLSGEKMPAGVKDIRFVDDCGYTSVWDEFSVQLKDQFGLTEFPIMYSTSLLCRLRYGWSFGEASAVRQVGKCPYPMLFIHGGSDDFVPAEMVRRLYDAKPSKKELWIAERASHAQSYSMYKDEYIRRVREFIK